MRKWFSSSSSRQAVTHNDVCRTNSSADSDDDTSSSLRSPRRRSTELGDALISLRNAREEGLRKLRHVEIQTTPAERQRNEIVSHLEQRTETVKSNLTLCQNALVPDSYTRFEVSPDRQIGNALQSAETVTAEWKNIRRTVKQAIRDQANGEEVLQAHPSMRRAPSGR
ncbi:type III effector [Ralstonia syzygii subsp. celebesensis]|uniref:Type III effector n=2 Tax=Ralstonia syzygii subsp. celebesensis TaxID=1310168 RepID=A0A1U9VHE4_9RALS|nr:type III effector [Ralstonia syzygii]AQW30124.1 type III effector [blood disease bacterium A2-HR MARDI]QQV56048.1 type III effector [Ralstonia syzygii subsp. celebesensis]